MDWKTAFLLTISAFGTVALMLIKSVVNEIKRMAESIERLNVKVGIIIERTDGHEKRISRLEEENHGQ